ncbi:MAG: tryptophan synthase subunit alpha [Bacillota bacterium]
MTGIKRIADTFAGLRERGEKGLISYITAGYPSKGQTLDLLKALAEAGSDLIEIGVPFSDPIADGPVIQHSSQQALAGGINLDDIFDIAGRFRSHTGVPVLLMTYYNPVFRRGVDNFVGSAVESGIDGFIVPDLPPEEDDDLRGRCLEQGLCLVPLAAPTSTDRRLEKIASRGEGFIYCVSVTGVTGSRNEINTDLKSFSQRIKDRTGSPLALGFGISGPEMARKASANFDAVVVGSAIVKAMEGGSSPDEINERVFRFAKRIKKSLRDYMS